VYVVMMVVVVLMCLVFFDVKKERTRKLAGRKATLNLGPRGGCRCVVVVVFLLFFGVVVVVVFTYIYKSDFR
jgi:protein-S-isoprenylcysteine O-methyltransferase Ste14